MTTGEEMSRGLTRTVIWTQLRKAIKDEFGVTLPQDCKKEVAEIINEIAAILGGKEKGGGDGAEISL